MEQDKKHFCNEQLIILKNAAVSWQNYDWRKSKDKDENSRCLGWFCFWLLLTWQQDLFQSNIKDIIPGKLKLRVHLLTHPLWLRGKQKEIKKITLTEEALEKTTRAGQKQAGISVIFKEWHFPLQSQKEEWKIKLQKYFLRMFWEGRKKLKAITRNCCISKNKSSVPGNFKSILKILLKIT